MKKKIMALVLVAALAISAMSMLAVQAAGIEVTVDGKHHIKALKINPDAVDPEDTEMLEDLITVAVNEAVSNAEKTAEDEMGAITGGLNMPGLF